MPRNTFSIAHRFNFSVGSDRIAQLLVHLLPVIHRVFRCDYQFIASSYPRDSNGKPL